MPLHLLQRDRARVESAVVRLVEPLGSIFVRASKGPVPSGWVPMQSVKRGKSVNV
jgi:hypothetical protein